MKTTIPLSTPIQAHGETISNLELGEPKGVTIRKCGMPFKLLNGKGVDDTTLCFDTEAIARYISELANIPSSSVDQLSAIDFNTIQAVIVGFFGGTIPPNASTGIGN